MQTVTRSWQTARWVSIPVLAFVALVSWAFASPLGSAPDDDYHLVSIWCAAGGSEYCAPGSAPDTRVVADGFDDAVCYAQKAEVSASCQPPAAASWDGGTYETRRGNFYGEYPPLYYGTMRVFAGDDVSQSALVMRVLNAALFVGLATALAALSSESRRRTVVWGWLITLVPLGLFLIPSNNPSGWALTGVGTAFVALLGWFESEGRRRWAFGALYLVGVLMAAGARGDAALYVTGASLVAMILTAVRSRPWLLRAILPAAGIVVAVVFMSMAGQAGVGAVGFTSDGGGAAGGIGGADGPLEGASLAAYNFLMIPFLWTGVWGGWGLGWLDTTMPAIVPWATVAAFVVVGFAGLLHPTWRKLISVGGVMAVLTFLPVYVLTRGADVIGENLQPRYMLPVVVLLGMVLATEERGLAMRFGRVQTALILIALGGANLIALQVNIRRYVTGADVQGFNLGASAEWWWHGAALGPLAVWLIGSLAFAGMLAALWPTLRPARVELPAEGDARSEA